MQILENLLNLFTHQKKRAQNQYTRPGKQPKVMSAPYIATTEYSREILSDAYRYYIDDPNPWTHNNDDGFLTQIWQEPVTANPLSIRIAMAIPDDYFWRWGLSRRKEDKKDENKLAVEKNLDHLMNPKWFSLRDIQEIIELAIITGHEGMAYELTTIDGGWKTITQPAHIDNRRFKPMRTGEAGNKFGWHLLRPKQFDSLPLEDENGDWLISNLMLFTYRNYEFTKKAGLSVAGSFYWEFRDYLYCKKFRITGIDTLMFPLAILTNDNPESVLGGGVNTAASNLQEQAEDIATKIGESGSGNIITVPYPGWKANLLDQEANKMNSLLAVEKQTIENIQNAILGSASMTMSATKTYGANEASSMVAYLVIKQDRKFHQKMFNQYIIPTLFYANIEKFAEQGITKLSQLPDIDFIADDIDPQLKLESMKAIKESGWRPDKEDIERATGMKLADRIEQRGESEELVTPPEVLKHE